MALVVLRTTLYYSERRAKRQEPVTSAPAFLLPDTPGVHHVLDDGRPIALHNHPHGIEAAAQIAVAVTVEPETSDPLDLAAFLCRDSLEGMAVAAAAAGLHLDERDKPIAGDDKIDLPATEAVVPLQYPITVPTQISRGEPLPQYTEVVGRHERIRLVRGPAPRSWSEVPASPGHH